MIVTGDVTYSYHTALKDCYASKWKRLRNTVLMGGVGGGYTKLYSTTEHEWKKLTHVLDI
jgi:hypothetical protein